MTIEEKVVMRIQIRGEETPFTCIKNPEKRSHHHKNALMLSLTCLYIFGSSGLMHNPIISFSFFGKIMGYRNVIVIL